MSTIKRSKTDAFSVKESVNIVKLAEAAFEQISLDQLTDVVVETPTDGDILVYSSDLMAWENVPQAGLNYDLEDLDNITITSVSDGQVLTWDSGTSKWVNETPVTGATTLNGLSDVDTLGVADGMVLMYNGSTLEWNAESLDYPNSLDDLTDVTITTPSNGQVLKYNGSAWVNGADSGASTAGDISYDNTTSGLTATNVQEAIDEVAVSATVNRSITAQFDGGSTDGNPNNIEVGDEVVIRSPYAITLSDWTLLLSDSTGNVSIDVQTKPFSSGSFTSITSSGTPSAISGANAEGTVSGWSSSSITSGHLIKLVVTARSGVVPRATLQLNGVQA